MLRTPSPRKLLLTLILMTSACTQPAAQIDLRGQNTYGQGSSYANYKPAAGNSSYSSPNYQGTSTPAAISPIGVSNLTPPTQSVTANGPSASAAPASSPFGKATPAPAAAPMPAPVQISSAQPSSLPSGNVNPWTNAPRSGAASNALDNSFRLSPKPQAANVSAKPQLVSDVQAPAPAKSPALDTIVSSENDAPPAKPAVSAKKAVVASNGFMWPVNSHKLISGFGPKGSGKANDGINIASASGEPVWAAGDGEVVYVGNELQGYGNMVIIKHSGNKTTTYAHLNRYTVDKYDRIKQGDIIGYVGNTGNVKEPQLHFAVRNGTDAVDPMKYLNSNVASLH